MSDLIDVADFRADARRWLEEQAGTAPRDWGAILPPRLEAEGRAWQRRLHDAGFAAIDWPPAAGGRGLTTGHWEAWLEEAARAGVPSVLNMVGLVLAAGALLAFGTPEQRANHLPPTARGERVWGQLFSEPGAGSDLASLATRATPDGGGGWVVTGQKVWSSGASIADWSILLARTDPDAPRHRGISFFAIDMTSPGIEVRPIRQMTGHPDFDEVFLDEVQLPASALMGPANGGWMVAMATLLNERTFIGSSAITLGRRLDQASLAAGALDAVRRDRLMQSVVRGRALEALGRRQGAEATAAASLLKLGLAELAGELANAEAAPLGLLAQLSGEQASDIVSAPGTRLGGGTSEIQRTIIGERLLDLPPEPRRG